MEKFHFIFFFVAKYATERERVEKNITPERTHITSQSRNAAYLKKKKISNIKIMLEWNANGVNDGGYILIIYLFRNVIFFSTAS